MNRSDGMTDFLVEQLKLEPGLTSGELVRRCAAVFPRLVKAAPRVANTVSGIRRVKALDSAVHATLARGLKTGTFARDGVRMSYRYFAIRGAS